MRDAKGIARLCLSSPTSYTRQLKPTGTFQMLIVALVHSRLDYCNAMLVALPAYLQRRLQSALYAAARLIYRLGFLDLIIDPFVNSTRCEF